jgi:hypothetical protein
MSDNDDSFLGLIAAIPAPAPDLDLVQRLAELEEELAGTRPQTASREKLLARRDYWKSLLREEDNLATRLERWRLVESPESPP